jgi:hypothetical protein
MPRGERPLENGPLREFAAGLRELRIGAGSPTYRELSEQARYSPSVLSDAAGGRKLPTLAVTLAYVTACGGDVAEWEARWRSLTAPVPAGGGPCPYVGLSTFQADDAGLFFGRERLVLQVLGQLRERRFVGVFGASGAGKSSLLRAGIAASDEHSALVVVPGARAFDDVAARLATSADELAQEPSNLARVLRDHGYDLLVVDQFEEVFTLCGEADRAGFIAALMDPTLRVVLGVRADFYGHCGQYPELVTALDGAQVLVGPMTPDELRRAIIRPAAVADCVVEEALVTRLVADVGNQAGALPLLSHVLRETWHRRQGISLTVAAYEKTGGLQHALAQSAEQTFTALTPAQQLRARQLFLRLVTLDDTRRRVAAAELDEDPDLPLVELTAARLITHDRHGVEITHEALIRHWPRLAGWLADDREGLRVHRRLTEAADVWASLDHDDEALYVGNRLVRAQEWADDHDSALSGQERDFLRASQSLARHAVTVARRRTRRLRILAAAMAVLFVIATGTAVVAVKAEAAQQATEQARTAAVLDRAAAQIPELLRQQNTKLAVQLAAGIQQIAPSPQHEGLLLQTIGLTRPTPGVQGPATFSADKHLLATWGLGGVVTVWGLWHTPPVQLATLSVGVGRTESFAISPLDKLIVTAVDKTKRVWRLSDEGAATQVATWTDDGLDLTFAQDGKTLAETDPDERTTRLVDLTDPSRPRVGEPLPGRVGEVVFSTLGTFLTADLSSTDSVSRWRLGAAPTRLGTVTVGPGVLISASLDGRTLATRDSSGRVDVWRYPPSGSSYRVGTVDAGGKFLTAEFNDTGTMLATSSEAGDVDLWRVGPGEHELDRVAAFANGLPQLHAFGFDQSGDLVASNYDNVFEWPTDEARIRSLACPSATMPPQDWDKWFPGIDYRSPC